MATWPAIEKAQLVYVFDISQTFLEPLVEELTSEARFGRRPTELLLNPRERIRIWEEIDPLDQHNYLDWANPPETTEDWIFGMRIVYLNCVPLGRALLVNDLGGDPIVVQDGPTHLAVIPT
jgi:hypothetical protein